jgi:hypothetical protein
MSSFRDDGTIPTHSQAARLREEYELYERQNQLRLHRERQNQLRLDRERQFELTMAREHAIAKNRRSREDQVPHELWKHDKSVYEQCAPSWRVLYDMGWYDREVSDQRREVYSESTENFLNERRLEKKGFWEPDYTPVGGHAVKPPRAKYSPATESYLQHKRENSVGKWKVFDH